jgi:hypothetical protein
VSTSYYLLDNPNPHGPHHYPSRRSPLLHIVLHITAGLEDLNGDDQSAEKTARYAATTDRRVSWHASTDSDSCFYLLPASYTAFHCKGFNGSGYGLEISKRNTRWTGMPAAWTEATLRHAARILAPVVRDHGIPLRRLTRAQASAGQKGFLYHSDADPTRRTDPGADFPLDRLFALIEAELAPINPLPLEDREMFRLLETVDNKRLYAISGNRLCHIQTPDHFYAMDALGVFNNERDAKGNVISDKCLQVEVDRTAEVLRNTSI